MNNKRQTIWLVSMLSLMVVLSAYYLFTEDVKDFDVQEQQAMLNEVKLDVKDLEQVKANTTAVDDKAAQVSSQETKKTAAKDEVSTKASAQVKSASDYFDGQQLKRTEDFAKRTEKLLTIITDSKQNNEAISKAYEDMNKIQEMEAKITGIEEKLMKDYARAMVSEEANKWKVVVQSDKLEKSEAVSIVDLVMQEMQIGPEKITVQYVH